MTDQRFRERFGPWAVIAGASEGLGAAFAASLAARGLDLVLVARRATRLDSLATQLATAYRVQARSLPLDLAQASAAEVVADATADLDVGLLVCNAAHSTIGPFFEQPLDEHLIELRLNCYTPLELVYRLGERMLARQRGGIVLMGSLSAAHGAPLIANYAATKAYNWVLAEGLWDELRGRGIAVTVCCAGATATPNYLRSEPRRIGLLRMPAMAAEAVVAETLAALGRQPSVIPGRANRVVATVMQRLLPRRAAIKIMGGTLRSLYPP
jgi:short-subunit dehydrogenase